MTVSQQKLVIVLKEHVAAVSEDERVPGYRQDLFSTLADIVALEREHRQAGIQIQKRISAKCEALGQVLANKGWGLQ